MKTIAIKIQNQTSIANLFGECAGDYLPSDYTTFQAAIARNLAGLSFVSTGACPGCAECGLGDSPSDHELDLASEAGFSWHACEACGSTLGGDRHPAHGRDSNGDILHLSVCTDCLYFLNYGQLDDSTMMEMQES